ncbi:hypothetical protein KP509_34G074000 [Ceratopteris richardii]|uniref:ABC transporter domain-containing protein n=1 Tax=Ceratopteris richardii TaxID=49495 RepID=A0A8T2QMX5_CERRI|nr:hypothetical protein KP509_34G074000 [Ceratopteris richardii]
MREGFGVNSNSDINMIETDKKQGSVMTASCEDGFKYAINSRNNNQFPDTSSHANHPLISKIRPDDAQEERDAIENSRRDVRIQKTHRLTEVPSGQTEDLVSHEDGLGAIQKNSVFIHENGSNSTSWLARISSGIDHKGRSEQEKLHVVDDGILSSGPVAANSGVSFFISRCPLPSQPVDNSKRTDQNVNSAIVRPEPDCETCQIATPTYDTSYSEKQGMALTFECVSYTVHKRRNRVWKQGIRGKKILQGVTGAVGAGEMLALMGPSGSGKTTLLSLLGGRHMGREGVAKGSAKGLILYDGASYSKTLNARMGFVTQDDLLYTHLTVEETLKYAALLRLPADMTRTQKADRVDEIIQQLGLERCRNTIIGSAFVRGISGGERKRVCIGHEIIINPSLLFLDEPTSGLDSTTALRIMFLLQRLAKVRGITIVTSVHQPSSRAFYLFDMLLLLAEGRCVYFGKARSAMQCFETWGFAPLMPMNPADFLLDVCSGNTFDMKVPPTLESAEHHETKDPVRIHKMSDGPSFNIEEIVQARSTCR